MSSNGELRRTMQLAKPFWGRIFGVSIIILVISLLNQVSPLVNKSLIDLVSSGETTFFLLKSPTIVQLIVLSLFLRITSTLLNRFSMYAAGLLSQHLRHHLRFQAIKHLMNLSVSYFNKNQSGKVMSKVSRGVDGIRSIISNIGIHFLPSILTALFSMIIIARYNLFIGLAAVGMFIPYYFLRLWRYKALEKIEKSQNKIWDRDYGHFYEVIGNIRLVKAFGSERHELNRLSQVIKKLLKNNHKMEDINNKGVVADVFIDLCTVGMYAYVVYLAVVGQFTVGTLFLMWQYIKMVQDPLWNLSWLFWDIKYAQISIKDYLKILDTPPDLTETASPIHLFESRGDVSFKNVWFKYPEKSGQEVFKGISFSVKPGKTVALVGKSGVGKTTIANLLVRFFDPDKGSVTIDGVNLRDLSFASIRKNVGLVMQDSYLFDDTIATNLRYAKPNATSAELEVACRIANAWEFISKLPKGLDTIIGERGIKLSGGQKQRLSIARTVLKNPKILILDEATSALDSHSEMLVQDALWKLIQGRTTIIIAHRLSTIQRSDQILVLDKKKIVETGTHQELIKQNGIYASLHAIQSGQLSKLKKWDLVS